jgi:predicted AAA+ superfamily ATPase
MKTIQSDVTRDDAGDIASDKTLASYMNALKRIFVIDDLPAWSPDMRSKTALRMSPKRHFVDPSIAAAALKVSPDSLLKDFNTFGLLFESLCIRDLRVYAQSLNGDVYHFRDKNGLEADAIIQLYDGRWGAAEIKMGLKETDKAAENLIRLRDKIDTDRMGQPSFLMIITASEYAYRRRDGVLVVPIGCLKN